MNIVLSGLGLLMIVSASSESQRAIGAVVFGAGLNDILREHSDKSASRPSP